MAKVQHSVEIKLPQFTKVSDMREFLQGVPDGADLAVTVYRGDRRDPREAGRIDVTLKATWSGEPNTAAVGNDQRSGEAVEDRIREAQAEALEDAADASFGLRVYPNSLIADWLKQRAIKIREGK